VCGTLRPRRAAGRLSVTVSDLGDDRAHGSEHTTAQTSTTATLTPSPSALRPSAATSPTSQSARDPAKNTVRGAQALTAIVADDHDVIQRLGEHFMRRSGCVRVSSVSSGAELLLKLEAHIAGGSDGREVVVLLDMHMPNISGRAALAAIRSDPDQYGTPFIIGCTSSGNMSEGLHKIGMDDFVPKPLTLDEFRRSITRAVARYKSNK
jgi:CheY-like chemotaxis protein